MNRKTYRKLLRKAFIKNAEEIRKYRGERKTYQEIADILGVSRQRVEQIWKTYKHKILKLKKGYREPHYRSEIISEKRKKLREVRTCKNKKCGNVFSTRKNGEKEYCSKDCYFKDITLEPTEKKRRRKVIMRKYFLKNYKKIKVRQAEYMKEYSKRPEVILKKNKRLREKYKKDRVIRHRKYCRFCKILGVPLMKDTKNLKYGIQYYRCRKCNRERCNDYYRNNKEKVMKNNLVWLLKKYGNLNESALKKLIKKIKNENNCNKN